MAGFSLSYQKMVSYALFENCVGCSIDHPETFEMLNHRFFCRTLNMAEWFGFDLLGPSSNNLIKSVHYQLRDDIFHRHSIRSCNVIILTSVFDCISKCK